jgi:hypothetical protein
LKKGWKSWQEASHEDILGRDLRSCAACFTVLFAPSEDREDGLPKWWWELWRFLLTLEFKQIIEPDFNVLMVGGPLRALDADTGTDVDGQPSWIAHNEDENLNATYFGPDEKQSQPVRICLASSDTRQAETHAAHPIQQEPREVGTLAMYQHA